MGDLEFWFIARITGLTAFAVLSLSVLSGEALRTSVLDFLAKNRAIRKLHDFTSRCGCRSCSRTSSRWSSTELPGSAR